MYLCDKVIRQEGGELVSVSDSKSRGTGVNPSVPTCVLALDALTLKSTG